MFERARANRVRALRLWNSRMLVDLIRQAYTAGAIKRIARYLGYRFPDRLTNMYLGGEPPEYIAAAILAVNQSGE